MRSRFLMMSLGFAAMLQARTQYDVQEIERTDEKELKIKLEYAAGKLNLKRTANDKLCRIATDSREREIRPRVDYDKDGTIGFLNINMEQEQNVNFFDVGKQDLQLQVTDKIPVAFNIDMGACEGDLDFTNLRIRDLTINLGASSSNIRFNAQNRDRINKIKIDAGVSKLNIEGLANANFDKLEFEGGVGNYTLDFSGNLIESAKARVSVGIGKLLVRIPKNLPVKIHTDESFLSSIRISEMEFDRRRDGLYVSKGFEDGSVFLEMWVEAGLGKLRVELIE